MFKLFYSNRVVNIYKITNIVNKKCYIGKTNDLEARWKKHIYYSKNPSNPCYSAIHAAIKKHNINNFTIELLESCESEEIAFEKEKHWIKHFKSNSSKGYNLNAGGLGGLSPNEETRKKIGASRTGDKHPLYGKKGPLSAVYGKKKSAAIIENMKKAKKNANIGVKNPRAKINPDIVKEIRNKLESKKFTRKEIAAFYVISKSTVAAIASGRIWGHVL